jgi:hypothetical protein
VQEIFKKPLQVVWGSVRCVVVNLTLKDVERCLEF